MDRRNRDLWAALTSASGTAAHVPGLPNACYTDPDVAALEHEALLRQTWACIGFSKDAHDPGDVHPLEFLDEPLVLVRGKDHTLRVFHNVCSHRGMVLVDKPARGQGLLRCPYHSWCYDATTGALVRTPNIGGSGRDTADGFARGTLGLREVRSTEWMGLVFVNLSGDAPPFPEVHRKLMDRWLPFRDVALHHGGSDSSLTFDLQANWKLVVENYTDACHLPFLHPALNSYSRLEDHFEIIEPGAYSGQGSTRYDPDLLPPGLSGEGPTGFPSVPGLPPFWETGAEYIAVYPNAQIGLHRNQLFTIVLNPKAVDRTIERIELSYFDPACRGDAYAALRATNQRNWRTVFEEDIRAVEGMQRGRASSGFAGGVLTAGMDRPTRCFHAWVAARLTAHLECRRAA